jgi:hypothetical protein
MLLMLIFGWFLFSVSLEPMRGKLTQEVDNDQVQHNLGEYEVGERSLGADGVERRLVLLVYLNSVRS